MAQNLSKQFLLFSFLCEGQKDDDEKKVDESFKISSFLPCCRSHKQFFDGRNLINNDPKAITPDNLSSLIKIHECSTNRTKERENERQEKMSARKTKISPLPPREINLNFICELNRR